MGIENFSDRILETNGRGHRSDEVFRAYQWARDVGIENINIDLIAGMLEETDDNWSECIERVLELSPDCVTIYQMEVPLQYHNLSNDEGGGEIICSGGGLANQEKMGRGSFFQVGGKWVFGH